LQVGQGAQGFLDIGVTLRAVHLVQVDPVRAEPPEAVLHLLHDPTPRVAALVGVAARLTHRDVHRTVELGGQDDVVPASVGECLPDDDLRLTL